MKLRNKKTGEIVVFAGTDIKDDRVFFRMEDERGIFKREINSIAGLERDWEDYEEPKDHYYIDYDGNIMIVEALDYEPKIKEMKQIGNYFETKEEAEKAVEKLKAWKRLKDKGFRFSGFAYTELCDYARVNISATMINDSINEDLMLLFGGEE